MKIFDFTDGVKGKELAAVKRPGIMGGWIVVKDGMRFQVKLSEHIKPRGLGKVEWCEGADNGFGDLKPETFGVGAIIFCMGEWKSGLGDPEWEWNVIGTTDWNREACRKGWLKATKLGPAFAPQDDAAA